MKGFKDFALMAGRATNAEIISGGSMIQENCLMTMNCENYLMKYFHLNPKDEILACLEYLRSEF